jgi:LPS-assembly protein
MTLLRPLLILLTCLAMTPVAYSLAAGNPSSGGDITIKADSMSHDPAEDLFKASGHVVVLWEEMTLNSDQADYNRKNGMLVATGNVVMIKDDNVMRGTQFSFDVATGKGELEHGTLTSVSDQGNITFTGDKIVRENDNNLLLNRTELTTCDLPNPSWKFGAEELKVNLLGYAIGKNIIFYVKDVPVLYLPWAAFPVVRDRRSGILFPRFGYSNTRGAEVDIPLYWVIAPNQDATLDLDMQTKRGVGIGSEYRYARKRGSEGFVGGYLIYDLHDDHWRGQIAQNHKEIFSPDMNLRMAINQTTDRSFLNDFGERSGDYNRQSNDSTINFLKTWQHSALTLYMRNSQDYYAPDNGRTLQTLPEISLATVRRKIAATPLYFDLDAGAANLYQEDGPSGQRLHAFPRLILVTALPEYINATAFAGVHLRAYNSDHIPAGSGIRSSDGDLLPEVGGRVSTSLSRVYTIDGENLKKVRHELVPELSYGYTPNQDQTRHPFYDYGDRLAWQNMATYSLTSHLGGKYQNGEVTEYRDLMRLKLSQGYSFEGTRRDLLTLADANRPWTDVILESDTWLHPKLRLTLDSRYNVYDGRISSVDPGMEFDDKRGNAVGASYRMSHNEVNYLEGRLSTKMFRPWAFGYTTRYSFDRPGVLESVYSAEYQQKCWSVNVALIDRPGNTSFHVNFNLAGLTGR